MDRQLQTTDVQGQASLMKKRSALWMKNLESLQVTADMTSMQVVKMGSPAICMLNNGFKSTEVSELFISIVILQLLEFLGVQWSALQVEETAKYIVTEYHGLYAAELKHFIGKVKRQEYSPDSFAKMTPPIFLSWLNQYWEQSLYTRGLLSEGESNKQKFEDKNKPNALFADENFKKILNTLDATKEFLDNEYKKQLDYELEREKHLQREKNTDKENEQGAEA